MSASLGPESKQQFVTSFTVAWIWRNASLPLKASTNRKEIDMTTKTFGFVLIVLFSASFAQDSKTIQLPSPQTDIGKPLMETLKLRQSSRSFDSKPLSLQELSNLLWAADGINRPESGKRTAPTAMNWQEVDIYVVLREGAYLYDANSHLLRPIAAGDLRGATGRQEFTKVAPLNLVYVSDHSRMTQASEQDKTLWGAADVGFVAQNVYLYCASQGLSVVVRGIVDREALAPALKLKPEQQIVLAQTVGYTK
jgi:SagB-type dehydrogenase family enzyme